MSKIVMTTPLVEMDGDEMTRIIWQMIKDELRRVITMKFDLVKSKNRYLHTGGKNHVFSPNCSLYRSDLGFSKTKFINFSTFSK